MLGRLPVRVVVGQCDAAHLLQQVAAAQLAQRPNTLHSATCVANCIYRAALEERAASALLDDLELTLNISSSRVVMLVICFMFGVLKELLKRGSASTSIALHGLGVLLAIHVACSTATTSTKVGTSTLVELICLNFLATSLEIQTTQVLLHLSHMLSFSSHRLLVI